MCRAGIPDARMVLCKGVDARGFQFFTNYASKKADDLHQNPHAALVFYWASLHRLIIVLCGILLLLLHALLPSVYYTTTLFQLLPWHTRLCAFIMTMMTAA